MNQPTFAGYRGKDGQMADLPPSAAFVLHVVAENEPLTRAEIRGECGLAETTLDQAIARLEDAGHIERREHPEDGRQHLFEVTHD